MTQRDTVIHLVAGGVAGTVGAIVTCPLEVVKTRLQSSSSGFHHVEVPKIAAEGHNTTQVTCKTVPPEHKRRICTASLQRGGSQAQVMTFSGYGLHHANNNATSSKTMNLIQCLRHIVKYEGTAALFKGLGPNLVGVAPSRAIYFCTYSQAKHFFNNSILPPDTPIVHVCSASAAGFVACTATNPIWFVKTRLQLDHTRFGHMTAAQCIRKIYAQTGIRGFYKGITASYMGISETVIHFVIYEAVKAKLIEHRHSINHSNVDSKSSKDFLEFMMAGAISKTVASCIAYPHEVARTRLREEGNKYNAFWQTLFLVWREEGFRGVYRGLSTQLVRQIPNTAIMMATYEAVVYMLTTHFTSEFYTESENS